LANMYDAMMWKTEKRTPQGTAANRTGLRLLPITRNCWRVVVVVDQCLCRKTTVEWSLCPKSKTKTTRWQNLPPDTYLNRQRHGLGPQNNVSL